MNETTCTPEETPSVSVSALTFSDGTKLQLDPTDVVVFVGPNNAGKTQALNDIEGRASDNAPTKVLHTVALRYVGAVEAVEKLLRKGGRVQERSRGHEQIEYSGMSAQIDSIPSYWGQQQLGWLSRAFIRYSRTENRLTGSNPVKSPDFEDHPASRPHHHMYLDDKLEQKICNHFRTAFQRDLVVNRLPGSKISLRVAKDEFTHPPQLQPTQPYLASMKDDFEPIAEQGDGMRSFATVLLELLTHTPSTILLLDEPEAFLHPPQARLLGRIIAAERAPSSQLFVASHSPDVLEGLLNTMDSDRIRIIRIHRNDDKNHPRELDKGTAKALTRNPVMKYLSALSGIFHDRVIVCESDGDCMFYSSILDLPQVNRGVNPDVHFVHTSGYDRMYVVVESMVSLGVKTDAIADLDILKAETHVRQLYEALGGD